MGCVLHLAVLPRPEVMLAAAAAIPETFLTAASLGTTTTSEPSDSAVAEAPLSSALAAMLDVVDADVGNKVLSTDGQEGFWREEREIGRYTPGSRVLSLKTTHQYSASLSRRRGLAACEHEPRGSPHETLGSLSLSLLIHLGTAGWFS